MFGAIPTTQAVQDAVFQTLEANGMTDGVHIRLTLTRGENPRQAWTPAQCPWLHLIVLPEYKGGCMSGDLARHELHPTQWSSYLDSKIHHNNCSTTSSPKSRPTMRVPTMR